MLIKIPTKSAAVYKTMEEQHPIIPIHEHGLKHHGIDRLCFTAKQTTRATGQMLGSVVKGFVHFVPKVVIRPIRWGQSQYQVHRFKGAYRRQEHQRLIKRARLNSKHIPYLIAHHQHDYGQQEMRHLLCFSQTHDRRITHVPMVEPIVGHWQQNRKQRSLIHRLHGHISHRYHGKRLHFIYPKEAILREIQRLKHDRDGRSSLMLIQAGKAMHHPKDKAAHWLLLDIKIRNNMLCTYLWDPLCWDGKTHLRSFFATQKELSRKLLPFIKKELGLKLWHEDKETTQQSFPNWGVAKHLKDTGPIVFSTAIQLAQRHNTNIPSEYSAQSSEQHRAKQYELLTSRTQL